jgi:hypothetical protein
VPLFFLLCQSPPQPCQPILLMPMTSFVMEPHHAFVRRPALELKCRDRMRDAREV